MTNRFASFFAALIWITLLSGVCLSAEEDNLRRISRSESHQSQQAQHGQQAQYGTRNALVIGNADYSDAPLRNPVSDAEAMAVILRKVDFTVTLRTDVTRADMLEAIETFQKESATEGEVALFYYSGHGMQINGINFLIPVDAGFRSQEDLQRKAVEVDRVFGKAAGTFGRRNIVILDACRDDPALYGAGSEARHPAGFAEMKAPSNTLIAFATSPGKWAQDGPPGGHSPYTDQLLKLMVLPGVEIGDLFRQVREDVMRETQGRQVPWEQSSLSPGHFHFVPGRTQMVMTKITESVPVLFSLALAALLLSVAAFTLACTRRGRKLAKEFIHITVRLATRRPLGPPAERPPETKLKPVLRALSGCFAGSAIELDDEPLPIGRDPRASGLVIPGCDSSLSKRHCVVSYDAKRRVFLIEDCWSLNGTFLRSGEKLQPGAVHVLQPGESFYLAVPKNLFQVSLEPVSERFSCAS